MRARSMRIAAAPVFVAILAPVWAQEVRLPANLDVLSAKAEESVDVTLDKSLLQLAARMIPDKDRDAVRMKKLVAGLDGIYVRSYEFAGEGEYSKADVEAVRAQLHAPLWARMVGVRSRHGHGDVDVYYKTAGDGTIAGVVLLSAEPRELTIVSIAGTLN